MSWCLFRSCNSLLFLGKQKGQKDEKIAANRSTQAEISASPLNPVPQPDHASCSGTLSVKNEHTVRSLITASYCEMYSSKKLQNLPVRFSFFCPGKRQYFCLCVIFF